MNEKNKGEKKVTFSRRYKIRMNRVFREYGGIKRIPYPEVDNLFERIRSKIIVFISQRKQGGQKR